MCKPREFRSKSSFSLQFPHVLLDLCSSGEWAPVPPSDKMNSLSITKKVSFQLRNCQIIKAFESPGTTFTISSFQWRTSANSPTSTTVINTPCARTSRRVTSASAIRRVVVIIIVVVFVVLFFYMFWTMEPLPDRIHNAHLTDEQIVKRNWKFLLNIVFRVSRTSPKVVPVVCANSSWMSAPMWVIA